MTEVNKNLDKACSVIGLILILSLIIPICSLVYGLYLYPVWVNLPRSIFLERLGIIFHTLAGLSVVIDIIGQKRLESAEKSLGEFYQRIRKIKPSFSWNWDTSLSTSENYFWLFTWVLWAIGIFVFWRLFGGKELPIIVSCIMGIFVFSGGLYVSLMAKYVAAFFSVMLFIAVNLLPTKRLLTIVTLPLFIAGSILQWKATFYP